MDARRMNELAAAAREAERQADAALDAGRVGDAQPYMAEAARLWRAWERADAGIEAQAIVARCGRAILAEAAVEVFD